MKKVIDFAGVAQEAASHRAETKPTPPPAKAAKPRGAFEACVRISLHMPPETIQSLKDLAYARRQTPSQLVDQLVRELGNA